MAYIPLTTANDLDEHIVNTDTVRHISVRRSPYAETTSLTFTYLDGSSMNFLPVDLDGRNLADVDDKTDQWILDQLRKCIATF